LWGPERRTARARRQEGATAWSTEAVICITRARFWLRWPATPHFEPCRYPQGLPGALCGSEDVDAVVTLDGLPIVEDDQAFYVPRTDLGCITTGYPNDYPLPEGTFSPAVFIQGIGFLANPLPLGDHILTLDGTFIVRDPSLVGFALGTRFDNTWNITVGR